MTEMRFLPIMLVSFVSVFSGFVSADEPTWQVGLASVRITPEEPVRMAGYASRKEPSAGVASDLYAKALALQDDSGHRGILITADLIGFRASLATSICRQIAQRTGLKRDQILLNASHTHTGPTLSLDPADLDSSADQTAATLRYTKQVQSKIVEVAVDAQENLQPARLSRGVGVASFVMNRREFTDDGIVLGFNPRGYVDRSVPLLRVDSPEGTLRGVLFGAACHNTTLGSRNLDISGDFAGYAQTWVEREMPGVQAMFMQGCAGDANPFPRGEEAIARKHGADLGREVVRVLNTELQPVGGPLRTRLKSVDLPLQSNLTRSDVEDLRAGRGGWRSFVADRMLQTLEKEGTLPEVYSTPIALWQFGQDLTLVGLSGEVVADFVRLLEEALGPRRLWIAAYCNDVYGYLPTARVLEQGGYETRGLYTGGIGLFSPRAQDVLVDHVRQMAASVRDD